jgi:hypothetical protein
MSHLAFLRPIQHQNNIGLILKRLVTLNFISKDYPNHVKFETSIGFTTNQILKLQMNGQGIFFKKVTFCFPLFKERKGTFFFNFFNVFNF